MAGTGFIAISDLSDQGAKRLPVVLDRGARRVRFADSVGVLGDPDLMFGVVGPLRGLVI